MELWSLETLVTALKNRESQATGAKIKQWRVREIQVEKEEVHFIQSQDRQTHAPLVDQNRGVTERRVEVTLYVLRPDGRQGACHHQIFPWEPLEEQLEGLQRAALLTAEEPWDFPGRSGSGVRPPVVDGGGGRGEDLAGSFASAAGSLFEAVARQNSRQHETGAYFNSAEMAGQKETERLLLSNGFCGEFTSTRVSAEVCFTYADRKSGACDEYLVSRSGCHTGQIDFAGLCRESAENARHLAEAQTAVAGEYSVLVGPDVLTHLLADVMEQLRAEQKYFHLPFVEIGHELFAGFSGAGFSLHLDPTLEGTLGRVPFDNVGLPQQPLLLASDNRVQSHIVTQRMSQYLKTVPTSSEGNLVLKTDGPGLNKEDLVRAADQVVEILQFSGLMTDPRTWTFSSEIRLARVYDRRTGKVTYWRGGSLAGRITEAFKKVQWSQERTLHNVYDPFLRLARGYSGPELALLSHQTIVA